MCVILLLLERWGWPDIIVIFTNIISSLPLVGIFSFWTKSSILFHVLLINLWQTTYALCSYSCLGRSNLFNVVVVLRTLLITILFTCTFWTRSENIFLLSFWIILLPKFRYNLLLVTLTKLLLVILLLSTYVIFIRRQTLVSLHFVFRLWQSISDGTKVFGIARKSDGVQ